MTSKLNALSSSGAYDTVSLIEPAASGYILIAAGVDQRLPFLPRSRAKRTLLTDCGILCRAFERKTQVVSAAVFTELLMPAVWARLVKRQVDVHAATFDVVVLIETTSIQGAQSLMETEAFTYLAGLMRAAARDCRLMLARNVRRVGPVDHGRAGVFLFNFFHAGDTDRNIAVWERAAGWLQRETGLDNSTLLRPVDELESDYTVIDHCRWDGLMEVIPPLMFKRSFRSYVLKDFEANNTVSMPVLYRLA